MTVKIYLAGCDPGFEKQIEGHHILVSFASPSQLKVITAGIRHQGILLDCGAFTEYKQGRKQDIGKYCEYIHEAKALLDGYFMMDVIQGGEKENIQNLDEMERSGLHPIPVYHECDRGWKLLDEFVSRGYPLIGLGATYSRGKKKLADWLDPIFDRYPDQNFHGLAMTQAETIRDFPFYSVDSTTWLTFAKFGFRENLLLLESRSVEFHRAVGIAALMDMPRCPVKRKSKTHVQMRLFSEE